MNAFCRYRAILVENGWGLFVPGLLVYLAGWGLGWPVGAIRIAVLMTFAGALPFLFSAFRSAIGTLEKTELIGWTLLFLLLWAPGAYLEYPSDPWEHFRRLFSWQAHSTIGESSIKGKYAYFIGWAFLADLPILWRRAALDIYAAAWQWLIAFSLYRFLRAWNFEKSWAVLMAISYFGFFGTNLFSARYYALSSTPLAYVAYWGAMTANLALLRGRRSARWELAFLILLMAFNHKQELIFLVLGTSSLFAGHWLSQQSIWRQTRFVQRGLFLFTVTFVLGVAMKAMFSSVYGRLGAENFSLFGALRFWTGPIAETLGLHGILSLSAGFFTWRRYPAFTLFCLAPFLLVIHPVFGLLTASFALAVYDGYRILYAVPTSLLLIAAISLWWEASSSVNLALRRVSLGALLVLMMLPSNYPWRGRLRFQLAHFTDERSLVKLDEMAAWMKMNRPYPRSCIVLSDNATSAVYAAHLGRLGEWNRFNFARYGVELTRTEQILGWPSVCGVLAIRRELVPEVKPSWVARKSGHWAEGHGDVRLLSSPPFEGAAEGLEAHGWRKTEVPPFYWLYQPPDDVWAK